MFLRLFLLFIIIPILEVYVLIQVGQVWGAMNVFFMVLMTAILGLSVSRSQGRMLLGQVQLKISRGEVPAREMLEGVLVFVGGILLFVPGFVTDVIGVTMIVPGVRRLWAYYFYSRLSKAAQRGPRSANTWQTPGGGFVYYSSTNVHGPDHRQTRGPDGLHSNERDVSPKQIIDIKPEKPT